MGAHTTMVTIGMTGANYVSLPAPLEVFTPYASSLLDWFATGKERTYTFRAMLPAGIGDDANRPIDITLAREHIAFIFTDGGA